MKRKYRLTRSTDFERVRRSGKSFAHRLMVIVILPNGLGHVRVGIAAGRSIGGAVQRNRAKRILRAAVQALPQKIAANMDIIFLARRQILNAKSNDLESIIRNLLTKAKVV